jgi:hypothetical protein
MPLAWNRSDKAVRQALKFRQATHWRNGQTNQGIAFHFVAFRP